MLRYMLLGGVAVVVVAGVAGYEFYDRNLVVHTPSYPAPRKSVWLEQNWTKSQSAWFWHADQGTRTFKIPFEWFKALRQPTLLAGPGDLFSNADYLDRFGFIADRDGRAELGLPIGFARSTAMVAPGGKPWLNPATGKPFSAVGLTCAGCHTGRMTYKGTEILVDGGPAITNLGSFRSALGISLLLTNILPWRFHAFATAVLGPDASAAAKDALKAELGAALQAGKAEKTLNDAVAPRSVNEGFSRLDALNRIGNQVFSLDFHDDGNYAPTSAPVRYPSLWDAPWFLWVQYNASIEQPMVRNAGEALGVSADFTPNDGYRSSVEFRTLAAIEKTLAGDAPQPGEHAFRGLRAPPWPKDILGDPQAGEAGRQQVAVGAGLYADLCQKCHLPPVSSEAFWTSPRWTKIPEGEHHYLNLEKTGLAEIGTDPAQATDMKVRSVHTPAALALSSHYGEALGKLVADADNAWYASRTSPLDHDEIATLDGNRPPGIEADLVYKARPLDGIWATPPYLHNGSVPTMYDLLSPSSERPGRFTLGNREYDPERMGYVVGPLAGGFDLVAVDPKTGQAVRGNSNRGHEFSDRAGPGVIGRGLSTTERMALISYLKTL